MKLKMATLKFSNLILLFTILLLFLSCSRKADDDEEIKTMIVGTWKARVHNSMFRDEYHLMEFTYDGRYRELTRGGSGSDYDGWNSADTTRYKGGTSIIAFGDSVYYYIENSTIKFYGGKSISVKADKKIEWIKPEKVKIGYNIFNDKFKYEKI